MLLHVVLFRPKPGLERETHVALAQAIQSAARTIPSVRRFEVGRSIDDPPPYAASGFLAFPFVATVEFDDRAGLLAYLDHPAHRELGRIFNETLEAALIYDYDTVDASEAAGLLDQERHAG
jgi:hypothetical protein